MALDMACCYHLCRHDRFRSYPIRLHTRYTIHFRRFIAFLLRQLAHPEVKFGALLVVFASWTLSLTVVWVAPLDLDMGQNEPGLLTPVWLIAYWTTSLLTWLVIPLQQSYYDSGHFRFQGRIKEAFRSNLQFYM
jgi:hypothetical protein